MRIHRLSAVLVFIGLLSLEGLGAAPRSWSAVLGVGGSVAPGVWSPLKIAVPADTGPWTLEVRSVSVSGRVSDPVVYAHPAGGEYEEPYFLTDAARRLKLRFLAGGLVQEEVDLLLGSRLFPGHIVGAEGLSPGVLTALSEVLLPAEPVRVVRAPASGWPTSALSYGSLSALVTTDPGPVLSPAQRTAVRAWVASGGRLVVVDPRPGTASLLAQIGRVPGWGRLSSGSTTSDPAVWKTLLGLRPYGQERLLGTDFEPSARDLPARGSALIPAAATLLSVWTVGLTLVLVLRRRRGLGPAFGAAALVTGAILLLAPQGTWDWDRGLGVHGREVLLPGELGRFHSLEVRAPTQRSGPFDWPAGSPWALALWKEGRAAGSMVKASDDEHLSLGAFLPPLDRPARYRVHWDGTGLRWSENTGSGWSSREEGPAELAPDGPWLAQMTARLTTVWSVGLDGNTCWLRPELPGGSL